MAENHIHTQELIQKISPIPLNLQISNTGDLKVSGDINQEELQPILDTSFLRYQLFLNQQKELDRESNLTAIYIGCIFSFLISLAVFCAFNQSPKSHNFQQSFEVRNHERNG
ncbi:MAG: hypothetical protein ACKPE3_19070 [Sphaerospermopsis kisseleviana]